MAPKAIWYVAICAQFIAVIYPPARTTRSLEHLIPEDALAVCIFTGGKEGGAVPCGCSSDQHGGLSQEAFVIDQVRREAQDEKIPIVLSDFTTRGASPDQDNLLETYAKQMGFGVLLAAHGDKPSAHVTLITRDGDGAVLDTEFLRGTSLKSIAFRKSDNALPLPWKKVIRVDGSRYEVNLPVIERGDVLIAVITSDGDHLTLGLNRVKTTSKDPTLPAVDNMVKAYYEAQAKAVQSVAVANGSDSRDSKLCSSCHAEAFAVWRHSNHARAMITLRERNRLVPECIRCHQIPDPLTDGNQNAVECTSCHRDVVGHLAAPTTNKLPKVNTTETCLKCHTSETDPKFNLEKRLHTIFHGGK